MSFSMQFSRCTEISIQQKKIDWIINVVFIRLQYIHKKTKKAKDRKKLYEMAYIAKLNYTSRSISFYFIQFPNHFPVSVKYPYKFIYIYVSIETKKF